MSVYTEKNMPVITPFADYKTLDICSNLSTKEEIALLNKIRANKKYKSNISAYDCAKIAIDKMLSLKPCRDLLIEAGCPLSPDEILRDELTQKQRAGYFAALDLLWKIDDTLQKHLNHLW